MPDYEYEKLSRAEYERALKALFGYTADEKPTGEAKKVINQALQQYDLYGWTMNLPYALEATAGRTRTAWDAQYAKAMEDWREDTEKAAQENWQNKFAYNKWLTEQGWKQAAWQRDIADRRWDAAQAAKERLWANWRAQQGVKEQQWAAQTQRWVNMANRMGGGDRSGMAQAWNAAISELIGTLDPNRDWAKIWQLKSRPNPYSAPEENINQLWEDVQVQQEEVKRWEALEKDVQKRFKDTTDKLHYDPLDVSDPDQQRAIAILRGAKTAKERLFNLEGQLAESATYSWGAPTSEGMDTGMGGTAYGEDVAVDRPWHPETPDWLSKFYGTEEESKIWGTKGKKLALSAPSPTAWAGLTPPQQERWMGYAEWHGADPESLLSEMWQALPQRKRGSSWRPVTQRVSI